MSLLESSLLVAFTAFIVAIVPNFFLKSLPIKGNGFAAPGWRRVADVFKDQLDSGALRGGGIAVYYEGEMVVEFTGGYADYEAEWPFEKDTLTCMFSSTKAVAATAMGLLVHRGLLQYDKAVSYYWPEFAQNGKQDITIEQLLSHQAGLAVIDKTFSAYDILMNPDHLGQIIAAQEPNWKPGDGHGYHGFTLGLYEDQLVRRIDPLHRSLSQFFAEEIADVFGLDIYIGLPKEENYRCARQYPFGLNPFHLLSAQKYWNSILAYLTDPDALISKVIANPKEMDREGLVNNPSFREIPSPATNGYSTAMSMAKLMGILANGGFDISQDRNLVPRKILDKLNEPLASGWDQVLLMNMTYSRGVSLLENPVGGYIFGAPGAGGQMAYADLDFKLGWAFFTNHQSVHAIADDPRYMALHHAIYECAINIQNKST